MIPIHWQARKIMKHFGQTNWFVLNYLIASANVRLRTGVGIRTIAKDLGLSTVTVGKALSELRSCNAIYNVPNQFRLGAEANLPIRSNLYQITGAAKFDNEYRPYIMMSPEVKEDIIFELEKIGDDAQFALEAMEETDNSGVKSSAKTETKKAELLNNLAQQPKVDEPEILSLEKSNVSETDTLMFSTGKTLVSSSSSSFQEEQNNNFSDSENLEELPSEIETVIEDAVKPALKRKRHNPFEANGIDPTSIKFEEPEKPAERSETTQIKDLIKKEFPSLFFSEGSQKKLNKSVTVIGFSDDAKQVYKSPEHLFTHNPLFREFVKVRIAQFVGMTKQVVGADGGNKTIKVTASMIVNNICNFGKESTKSSWNGWVLWEKAQAVTSSADTVFSSDTEELDDFSTYLDGDDE